MIPLCSHPILGEDITELVFNPMNWCQICAVKSKALTIWNVERCGNYHLMKPRYSVSTVQQMSLLFPHGFYIPVGLMQTLFFVPQYFFLMSMFAWQCCWSPCHWWFIYWVWSKPVSYSQWEADTFRSSNAHFSSRWTEWRQSWQLCGTGCL